MANYRVRTIKNNSNMTAQGKTNKKQQQQKMNQFRLLKLKQRFLEIAVSYILHLRMKLI
jgi:hypothetical protein